MRTQHRPVVRIVPCEGDGSASWPTRIVGFRQYAQHNTTQHTTQHRREREFEPEQTEARYVRLINAKMRNFQGSVKKINTASYRTHTSQNCCSLPFLRSMSCLAVNAHEYQPQRRKESSCISAKPGVYVYLDTFFFYLDPT